LSVNIFEMKTSYCRTEETQGLRTKIATKIVAIDKLLIIEALFKL